jgi:hypothetical protein
MIILSFITIEDSDFVIVVTNSINVIDIMINHVVIINRVVELYITPKPLTTF